MKLEYNDLCVSPSIIIDNKENDNISIDDYKEAIIKIINSCNDIATIQDIFIHLMTLLGEYKDLGLCDECGEWNSIYTLNI